MRTDFIQTNLLCGRFIKPALNSDACEHFGMVKYKKCFNKKTAFIQQNNTPKVYCFGICKESIV